MTGLLVGTSGWNYGDSVEKGGWVGSVYPESKTKRLSYYSQLFHTAELDATFYERFYSKMTPGTFFGMIKATPDIFQFSVKVPETVTHDKRLDVKKGAMDAFNEFLEKISPLKKANKLGAILIQLPPSFSVNAFKQTESFLDGLPPGYEYALEFRHPSWQTEGPWEMLKHYNVAAVMTDSPDPKLQYLSNIVVTADHAFIRFHGRNKRFWYNYLYSKEELQSWVPRVNEIKKNTRILRIYFNNHYGGQAVLDALLFAEMLGGELTPEQVNVKNRIKTVLAGIKSQKKMLEFQDTPSPSSAS
jgi:uncharacterized protein YecE (DUF72 family)